MNGGYFLIDGTGLNLLADSSQTITGIYKNTKAAIDSGKPIWVCGMEYGSGVPLTPVPIFCIEQGGEICGSSSILQVWIAQNDSVRVVSLLS